MVEPGTTLQGKYRIERVIARGGMGVVARAHHLQLDVPVAIKFLLPDTLDQPEVARRFLREAQAAVKLKSEHVCRVIDVGTLETGGPFMVMEYLEGTDLRVMLREQGPLDPGFAVDLVLQACEALAEAHAGGIVHRDIKPANLFLAQGSDGGPLIKLLDFGVSKAPMTVDEGITHSQVLLGTPVYMSPEQLESSKDVDVRTDIWALGVVLYELVSGRRPFHSASFPRLVMMISSQPMQPIENVALPAGLGDAIARCLEKEPGHRFQRMSDLATALAPYAGTPTQAARSIERTARVLGLATGPIVTSLVRADSPVPMPPRDTFRETAGEQVPTRMMQPARPASGNLAPGAPGDTVEASLATRAEPRRRRGLVIAVAVASVLGLALALVRVTLTDADRVSPMPARAVVPATVSAAMPAVQPLLAPDARTAPATAGAETPASPDAPATAEAETPASADATATAGGETPASPNTTATTEAPATDRPAAEASSAPASSERRASRRERRKRRHAPEKAKLDEERAIEDAFESRN